MSTSAMLEPLLAPIAAIQRLIEKLGGQGIIIGGVAASLLESTLRRGWSYRYREGD